MKRKNQLSSNLRAFQRARCITQAEFARELQIPKSTLQTVMMDGNTSLDTLIHIADALNTSLDELVFGEELPGNERLIKAMLRDVRWYVEQPPERQEEIHYYFTGMLDVLTREEVLEVVNTGNDVRSKRDGDL